MNRDINIDFQMIVDRVIGILGKNINIMNRSGIIVASGDKERINTFHKASMIAASKGKEIIVDDSNEEIYKGSKKGVNLPINYDGHVIGVVGITGNPQDVKPYGLIVKELVELMAAEEGRKNAEILELRAKKNFALELIRENDEKEISIIKERARLINFDLNIKRVVICCDIIDYSEYIRINSCDEIFIQNNKQQILDIIRNSLETGSEIAFNLEEDRFIIIKNSMIDVINFCREINKKIYNKLGVNLHMAAGSECLKVNDYHFSYLRANDLLKIGKKVSSDTAIYLMENLRMHLLLSQIKEDSRKTYLSSFKELFRDVNEGKNRELIETVITYFKNRMSIKETSDALFVHRNTINYRLSRFNEIYDLDPSDPYLCMQIYIGYEMFVLNEQNLKV